MLKFNPAVLLAFSFLVGCGVPPRSTLPTINTNCGNDQVSCGGECTNTNNDRYNCGGCGTVCQNGESCVAGNCGSGSGGNGGNGNGGNGGNGNGGNGGNGNGGNGGSNSCPGGQQNCGAGCTDTTQDPANCGGCGNTCSSNQTCSNSQCVAVSGGNGGNGGGNTGGNGGGNNGGGGNGGSGGTDCPDTINCLNNATDSTSQQNCLSSATSSAQTEIQAILTCLDQNCSSTGSGPCANSSSTACSNCLMQVQKTGGACYNALNTCNNDTAGGTAGGGGNGGGTGGNGGGTGGSGGGGTQCTTETWSGYAQSFFQNNCTTGCHNHSFGRTSPTYSTIQSEAADIASRIQGGSMPPGGGFQSDPIITWLNCGAPM